MWIRMSLICMLGACVTEEARADEQSPIVAIEPAPASTVNAPAPAAAQATDACGDSAAGAGWFSAAIPERTGVVAIETLARVHEPDYQRVDMALGFADGVVADVSDLVANVHFAPSGTIVATDGDADRTDLGFRFDYDRLYTVRFEIDLDRHVYSAFVRSYGTPGPGDAVARDYAFRTAHANASRLDTFAHAVTSATGTLYGCVGN